MVSVSIDDDREKFERAVKNADLPWSQVFDGQGTNGPLVKLFNARAVPVSYLIDAQGKIAAKIVVGGQLRDAVSKVMEK
jgi:hypothetical protein